jgi:hypothetical protein
MTTRAVEVLFFEGCPSVDLALERVHEAVAAASLDGQVTVVQTNVRDNEDAQRRRFLGSPSVRVDGRDVDPAASARADFGIQCRVYPTENGMEHAPPAAWIIAALT